MSVKENATAADETDLLSKDEFVDVTSEHGAGREHGGVGRGHDGRRDGAETDERHPRRTQVLHHHRQDHLLLLGRDRNAMSR